MPQFLQVILPLPLNRLFTYSINKAEADFIQPGMRVAVPFGKSKLYTAIAVNVLESNTSTYEIKDIEFIIDETPVVTVAQLKFWEWIASYYVCSLGQVMRAALPKSLLLESETVIIKNDSTIIEESQLDDREFLVMEALSHRPALKIQDIISILDRKTVLPILKEMLAKEYIILQEELRDSYKSKLERFISLAPHYQEEDALKDLLDNITRSEKQRTAVMTLFMMQAGNHKPVLSKNLQERSQVSRAVIKGLIDKEILIEEQLAVDRVLSTPEDGAQLKKLNDEQANALEKINDHFSNGKTTLIHGVTSSGKTEIYVRLIQQQLDNGNQCLYLLPEIALTTQLITRLQHYFKDQVLIYHSRYSVNERLEVWNHILKAAQPYVIIGARSAVLLPFNNLGLIIVDEEHETSFKQQDPAPRYHARDSAVMLAYQMHAQVLMGSATPSIESYDNAISGKYGLVELKKRFNNVLMPEIYMVDLKDKYKRKKMTGLFSDTLIDAMTASFKKGEQVILFQNRRGYAPIIECHTCGNAPQCINCDVSMTYHKFKNQLRCHYCGSHGPVPVECASCGSHTLDTKGFGTEQIETQFKELFPDQHVVRMDLDTTRGKNAFQNIITKMDSGEIDCLVGTQMLTKGLDFRNVGLVGVINADSMLNFPDFRAHERCFQLLTQVAGRAGRTENRGQVLIQTYQPEHNILQQVSSYRYKDMFREQLQERYTFAYPPYQRLIRITMMHRSYDTTQEAGLWMATALRKSSLNLTVLGPEFPPVARMRNRYHIHVIIKITKSADLAPIKEYLRRVNNSFESIKLFRPVRVNVDVDFY